MIDQFDSMGVRDHFPILWLHWPSLMRAPANFFSPYGATHNEAPKRKILLRWSSRMRIYGFVSNAIFFSMMEQFDSMGVRDHFPILWLRWPSLMRGFQHTFFQMMEPPTVWLPNVKILLHSSSRMRIYGFL